MVKVVEVKQREEGKVSYYTIGDMTPSTGDYVILESDRGLDYGQVLSGEEIILDADMPQETLRKIVRIANKHDIEKIERNQQKAKEVVKTCEKKIAEHKLNMKLIDAELSFD